MAKAEQRPAIAFQMLEYPITNHGFETRSYRENGEGYYLTRAAMQWYWRHYLSGAGEGESPYASPLRAEDVTDSLRRSSSPRSLILCATRARHTVAGSRTRACLSR